MRELKVVGLDRRRQTHHLRGGNSAEKFRLRPTTDCAPR